MHLHEGHCPLAVFAPQVGERSESFIRRHVEDILPGQTAVITKDIREGPDHSDWGFPGPVLCIEDIAGPNLRKLMADALARKLGFKPASTDRVAAAIHDFLTVHRVEVLMGEFLDQSLYFLPIARSLGIRFVGHGHGYDVSMTLRDPAWCSRYLAYNDSDGVVVVSRAARDRLTRVGIQREKIHVVPGGTDVPDAPPVRGESDTINCLALGRMVGKRGPIMVLDAFRRASEACPELRMDYVGGGPLLSAAMQYVLAFELNDRVRIHGSLPDRELESLWREADVYLQHSMIDPVSGDEEGLPITVCEAMARALPVVSTRHAGIPEAVADGLTGLLVDEGDTPAMAEHIVRLARGPALRAAMGEAAWRRARELYTWERQKSGLRSALGLEGR